MQKQNERIICDCYEKGVKRIWGKDTTNSFNQKIVAVNNMYEWLYNKGVLKEISFEFKDYSDCTFFAFDVKDLLPYRERMTKSNVFGSELAIQHIFNESYSPCEYCGAITLSWLMQTYRDFDGTVGRGWECDLCNHLDSCAVLDVLKIREEKGIKDAVKTAFMFSEFESSDI